VTTAAQHARALSRGAWQCPACPLGWMQFDIAVDMNVCPSCGYHGGPAETKASDVVFHVECRVTKPEWVGCRVNREWPQDMKSERDIEKYVAIETEGSDNLQRLMASTIQPAMRVLASKDFSAELAQTDTVMIHIALCRTPAPNTNT
jgi:hypothetical protein